MPSRRQAPRGSASRFVRSVGPELVAAASDNDPTNVGTAAAVGARSAYALSWVAWLVAPLLWVVQAIAAQVAVTARSDLQSLAARRYGRGVGTLLLASVAVVNVATMAADLQAGAAGLGLLVGVDARWLVAPLGIALGVLLAVGTYRRLVTALRYVLLGFLGFGVAAVLAHPSWPRVLVSSVVPRLSLGRGEVSGTLALLGTTLTGYVYVFETVERGVEEPTEHHRSSLRRVKAGAALGAIFTAVVLWSMLVASAATLGHHHEMVASAADAARALRPLAGPGAADLFAVGLVASALVALPVLAATTAYVVGAHFRWRRGLSGEIAAAPGSYVVLIVSIGMALAISEAGVAVVSTLLAASIIGGLGTPIGLVLLVLLARDREIMGSQPISRPLALAGWAIALFVAAVGVAFVVRALQGL